MQIAPGVQWGHFSICFLHARPMYYLSVTTSISAAKKRHHIKFMEIKGKVVKQLCLESFIPSVTYVILSNLI